MVSGWTWERIVELNKLICEASGQPHAIRYAETAQYISTYSKRKNDPQICFDWVAKNHPFVEGNKRTAVCLAACLTLEDV